MNAKLALYVLGGIVAFYQLFLKKAGAVVTTGRGTLPASYGPAITAIVNTQGAGGAWYDQNPDNYKPEDQEKYPGWYRSDLDGSWFNPATGDFYSAGSSPVAVVPSYWELHPDERPQIDLTATTPGISDPTSMSDPVNGYVVY